MRQEDNDLVFKSYNSLSFDGTKELLRISGDTGDVDIAGDLNVAGTIDGVSSSSSTDSVNVAGLDLIKVVEGTNPSCPSGYYTVHRYWLPRTCSGDGFSCTTPEGWNVAWEQDTPYCSNPNNFYWGFCYANTYSKILCKANGLM